MTRGALEAAVAEFCNRATLANDFIPCEIICDACKDCARIAVLVYLRALAEVGPSQLMSLCGGNLIAAEFPQDSLNIADRIWTHMLRAHIKELKNDAD